MSIGQSACLLALTSESPNMAARTFGVWGIDLGQCALKAIRLEMKDGQPVATAFEYIEHPKILSQPDADPDELIREALSQFLSRNKIKGDFVAISVPGQSGLARFVKLPPVDEKKIADIVKFEAKQQIPFPLEDVVWDFQRLNRGDIVDGLALETEIGLFAMKRDMVTRAIAQFKDVNVEVHLVQMAPLALCNFIAYDLLNKSTDNMAEDDDSHECIVCLEIGTDSSNLVITDGGRIIWQRPIPIGGNHFTRALTKEMKLTFAKAEHLKKNAAKSPDLKKILSSLKQVLNDFVGEVQRSLGYFTNTHRNAQIQYMIGLGNAFRLPGLQKFLQEKLQLEVRKLQHLERATGESVTTAPTFSENIMSFGVAYGLALQGLKQARLQTNLLPYEVRLERVIRGKKPWVVTAAASLIVGMSILAFARGMERKAVENDEIKRDMDLLKKKGAEANDYNKKYADEEEQLKKYLGSLNRIGAGVDERMNWQLLHQYVNSASPQPNGDRLTIESKGFVKVKNKYLNADGKKAFGDFEDIKFGKLKDLPPEKVADVDRFIKQHLIQVNIAGINALYTEDLGSYFRKLSKDSDNLNGMGDQEMKDVVAYVSEKDPEKAKLSPLFKEGTEGWVVEVRGYTYHKDKSNFILNTIIENLKYPLQLKDAEMKQRVESRVGYLHIYKEATENNPIPGQFRYIGKSYLKTLVKGLPPEGVAGDRGPVMPQQPIQLPGVPGTPEKANRDTWRPIGEQASSIYGDNIAGPGQAFVAPPLPVGTEAPVIQPVPRYEFVLVFIWREPQQTITLDEKK
jgi:type IV pilus assembly protein PilM